MIGKTLLNFVRFNKITPEVSKIKPKSPFFDIEHPIAPQSPLSKKVAVFQKHQLGKGQSWLKLAEIGKKWILEP